ncbi:MAG: response regulator [Phycisphaerae bacterium]|nr:response regulator [Phycisphaerae bacterium]
MKKRLSTTKVARLLRVSVASVANWIDQGQLVAGRTPGGHRRIEVDDLIRFIRHQKLRVPPELMDRAPKVLVADDEVLIAKWLTDEIKVRHPDWEVLQAHDGFTTGDLVGSFKPDVVVLDIRMPGVNGLEVCRRIKSREDTKGISVIAITAYTSGDVKDQILGAGARAYFVKPLDIKVIMAEVESAMSERL